jgi:hypothetical protein
MPDAKSAVAARSDGAQPGWRRIARRVPAAWFVVVNLVATANAVYKNCIAGVHAETYQVYWAGAMGVAELVAARYVIRAKLRPKRHAWLWFAATALSFTLAEELTCFLVGTGIFKHRDEAPLVVLFAVGTGLIWLCALGGFAVFRWFRLRWYESLLLFAFAGALLEAFPFQKLYRHVPLPIVLGLICVAAAWHYVLIGLFPFWLASEEIESLDRWDHPLKWPLGVLIPMMPPTLVVLTLLR